MADTVSVTPETVAAAIKATEYKYFGDYEMSEDQRAAIDTLVAVAKTYFPSTQPAPAFPREEVAKALWSVSQNCSWDDAKADSDCSNAVKGCYEHADAVAALLQGKQP